MAQTERPRAAYPALSYSYKATVSYHNQKERRQNARWERMLNLGASLFIPATCSSIPGDKDGNCPYKSSLVHVSELSCINPSNTIFTGKLTGLGINGFRSFG